MVVVAMMALWAILGDRRVHPLGVEIGVYNDFWVFWVAYAL